MNMRGKPPSSRSEARRRSRTSEAGGARPPSRQGWLSGPDGVKAPIVSRNPSSSRCEPPYAATPRSVSDRRHDRGSIACLSTRTTRRRRRRRWTSRVKLLPIEGPLGRDPTVAIDDRDLIERAFARLTPEQRAVWVLHHDAGLPVATIAQVVGVPEGTVKFRHVVALDVPQSREVSPGEQEGLLHGVLGGLDVAQDPVRDRQAAVTVGLDEPP